MTSTPDVLPRSPGAVQAPLPTRFALAVERWPAADRLAAALQPLATPFGPGHVGDLLRDRVLGHALHPALTDLPLAAWTAAAVLDVRRRREERPAATAFEGLGVLATVPTALTGLAEWTRTDGAERRVGATHAVANTAALALHVLSWAARRSGRHHLGVATATAANGVVGLSALLGGHLTTVRKVGSAGVADADGTDVSTRGPA